MSGDGTDDVRIPSVFLFSKEGNELIWSLRSNPDLVVFMGDASPHLGLSGPEYALTFNTGQLRLVLGLDRHKSCSPMEPLLVSSSSFSHRHRRGHRRGPDTVEYGRRMQCLANEYKQLRQFYALFDDSTAASYRQTTQTGNEDKDGEIIQITAIGDVILIKTSSAASSSSNDELEIDLEPIEREVRQTPGQAVDDVLITKDTAYVAKVFENLLTRFVKQTNFVKLPNTDKFSKTLFNYVNWTLNPNQASFDENDRANMAELARLLKPGP